MDDTILAYNNAQEADNRKICERLAVEILQAMPKAENKIWHGAPVWFLAGNPIVGYDVLKDSTRLLFWSGQSFDEPGLQPEGTFKAAEARYTTVEQVNTADLQKWLEKAKIVQWDYKNIVKRRGELVRLDVS
jgi:hypothetical protein